PYDDLHDIDLVPSPVVTQDISIVDPDIVLETEDLCEIVCLEICDNGIDDDEDGLIDQFDDDCPCTDFGCKTPSFNRCVDCQSQPPTADEWELQRVWVSDRDVGNSISVPFVGDLDGDCLPEVVAGSREYNEVYILDGQTGQTKFTINSYNTSAGVSGNLAIADVDSDGWGDIFISTTNDNPSNSAHRLVRYEYDGNGGYVERFISQERIGPYDNYDQGNGRRYHNMAISLADINGDGAPEAVVGNQIFNALTGELITRGGAANSTGSQRAWVSGRDIGNIASYTVLADVLPTSFCALCDGLELVAGNMVYAIFIPPGGGANSGTMQVAVDMSQRIEDGFVSVADVNFDGNLDVVTARGSRPAHNYRVSVWSPIEERVYDEEVFFQNGAIGIGRIAVGNVDNNENDMEICFHLGSSVYVYSFNSATEELQRTANISTVQDNSVTGLTIFDFNGDGRKELVYRDERNLRILRGTDLSDLVQPFYVCSSGTSTEYPIIADVNADGQTEIIVNCDTRIEVIGNAERGRFWMPSRQVWNQFSYFYTNINDDLTIPAKQQGHHLVGDKKILNAYLQQYADPTFPVADARIDVLGADCLPNGVEVTLLICNEGDNILPASTPIAVYQGNPTRVAANPIDNLLLGSDLAPDSCEQLSITTLASDSIFIVVNDDQSLASPYDLASDFPVTPIAECNYTNNIAGIEIDPTTPILDLGPDISVCENGVFTLDAGPGFSYYLWQDGSTEQTYTAFEPGKYWVEVPAGCGETQSDTINIFVEPGTVLDLGPDITICNDDPVFLSASGFDKYEWFPDANVDCNDCPQTELLSDTTISVIVVGSTDLGCISVDTIQVVFGQSSLSRLDTSVCQGEAFVFDGVTVLPGQSQAFSYQNVDGCDSVILVSVTENEFSSFFTRIDTSICQGSLLRFGNQFIPIDTTMSFLYETVDGCDSIVEVSVAGLDTFFTETEQIICPGDSILIFGNYQRESGNYQQLFNSMDGCDSTAAVQLTVLQALDIDLDITPTCRGEDRGAVQASVSGGLAPYEYVWSIVGAEGNSLEGLSKGDYWLIVTDDFGCMDSVAFTIDTSGITLPPIGIRDVSCFGERDGSLFFDDPQGNWSYALDSAVNFVKVDQFVGLSAGTYTLHLRNANGCQYSRIIEIGEPFPPIVELPEAITIELGDEWPMRPQFRDTSGLVYSWTPPDGLSCDSCAYPIAKPLNTTDYSLSITDLNGCTDVDTVRIVVEKPRNVFIPNVFSPNGDGINDVFLAFGGKEVDQILRFRVYDRWGENIFEGGPFAPNDPFYGWDGTFKGQMMNNAVFVYIIDVSFIDGLVLTYSGSVTLVK
ncbi:MAG: FG-GAP-like repeat-containing protein, partial [Bacteroidota bacterium]